MSSLWFSVLWSVVFVGLTNIVWCCSSTSWVVSTSEGLSTLSEHAYLVWACLVRYSLCEWMICVKYLDLVVLFFLREREILIVCFFVVVEGIHTVVFCQKGTELLPDTALAKKDIVSLPLLAQHGQRVRTDIH